MSTSETRLPSFTGSGGSASRAVIAENGGHERCVLHRAFGRHWTLPDLLQPHIVRAEHPRVDFCSHLAMPARGQFVVMALDVEAAPDHACTISTRGPGYWAVGGSGTYPPCSAAGSPDYYAPSRFQRPSSASRFVAEG